MAEDLRGGDDGREEEKGKEGGVWGTNKSGGEPPRVWYLEGVGVICVSGGVSSLGG